MNPEPRPDFSLLIIGDEILSGKRADKHLTKCIELLGERGLALSHAEYVGDSPAQITATLQRAFASGGVVFSCGGIGATPDDHTRQCAANALGVDLALHPQAAQLIHARMEAMAREQGTPYDPDRPENLHRLNMGVFPVGCSIIPNPYNQIPGFFCASPAQPQGAAEPRGVYFVPGFPVMAWPMMAWVLDTHYRHLFHVAVQVEKSVIIYGAMEGMLTPLMQAIEREHAGIKVFSLPSVDHPQYGRHVELGVKGTREAVEPAYQALRAGLVPFNPELGPELVRP